MRVGRKVKHEEACDRVPLVEGVQSLLTTQMKTRNALGPSRAHPTDFLKQFSFSVSLKQHLYMEEDAVENKPLSLESSLTRLPSLGGSEYSQVLVCLSEIFCACLRIHVDFKLCLLFPQMTCYIHSNYILQFFFPLNNVS